MSAGAVVTGASYAHWPSCAASGGAAFRSGWSGSDEHALAASSRYAGPRHEWPGGGDERARVEYLLALAEREHLRAGC